MTTRIAADYTTRSNYQKQYAKENREAINARKRAWRKARKDEIIVCGKPIAMKDIVSKMEDDFRDRHSIPDPEE